MSNAPAPKAFIVWDNSDGAADFIQLKTPSGAILGWIDPNGVGSGNLSGFARVDVSLSSSDLLNLGTTPKILLPPAPAGFYYNPFHSIFKFSFGGVPYTVSSALAVHVGFGGVSGVVATTSTLGASTNVVTTQNLVMTALPKSNIDGGNMSLVGTVSSGNGTAIVSIFYTLETTPT